MSEVAPSVGGGAPTLRLVAAAPRLGTPAAATLLLRRVLRASQDRDPLRLQAQLDLAASVLGLARCLDEIVAPAMRHLHRLVATGERDAGQELMAREAVRSWLTRRGSSAPSPHGNRSILLACGPRDRDMIGLESLGLLLREGRTACRVLGARVSTFDLTIAALAGEAAGVVVLSDEDRGRPHAVLALRAVDALGIPVFFAGTAFRPQHRRRYVPGRYLGTTLAGACALLINAMARLEPEPLSDKNSHAGRPRISARRIGDRRQGPDAPGRERFSAVTAGAVAPGPAAKPAPAGAPSGSC